MAKKTGEGDGEKTPEELAEERAADLRRANANHNQSMIDRRNAIADGADGRREGEFDDISDDGRIVKRSPEEDAEARAAAEEAAAEAERARLLQTEGGDPDDGRPAGGEGDGDGQGDRQTPAGEGEDPDSKLVDGKRVYRLKVNGKEIWLTLSEIRERAGKVEAADEYLHAAAESARKAVALKAPPEAEGDEEPDAALVEELNKALLGDPDSVKKLARRLSASPSRVTPDVMQAVDERLTFRDAVSWFEGEYKAELADPRLKQMIVQEDVRLRDENPTMPYRERLKKAGDSIRGWAKGLGWRGAAPTGQGNGEGGTPRVDKAARKQQYSAPPAAGGRQATGGDDNAEEPVSAQIERMAKGRHQERSIKH